MAEDCYGPIASSGNPWLHYYNESLIEKCVVAEQDLLYLPKTAKMSVGFATGENTAVCNPGEPSSTEHYLKLSDQTF